MVAEPRQFEAERGLPVAEIHQHERSVGCLLAADLFQPERLVVEVDAACEVRDIDIEMVETAFDFHIHICIVRRKIT